MEYKELFSNLCSLRLDPLTGNSKLVTQQMLDFLSDAITQVESIARSSKSFEDKPGQWITGAYDAATQRKELPADTDDFIYYCQLSILLLQERFAEYSVGVAQPRTATFNDNTGGYVLQTRSHERFRVAREFKTSLDHLEELVMMHRYRFEDQDVPPPERMGVYGMTTTEQRMMYAKSALGVFYALSGVMSNADTVVVLKRRKHR